MLTHSLSALLSLMLLLREFHRHHLLQGHPEKAKASYTEIDKIF